MTERTNWKKKALMYEEDVNNLVRTRDRLQRELDGIKAQNELPWKIEITEQAWEGLKNPNTETVKQLIDAGLWFIELGGSLNVSYSCKVRGQTLSFKTRDEARRTARQLLEAGIWFAKFRRGAV